MAPDVYLKRDIANIMSGTCQAIVQTVIVTGPNDSNNLAFCAGVRTVLFALAVNFGIPPEDVVPRMWEMTLAKRVGPPQLDSDGS